MNCIVISIDSLRYDHVGAYGNEWIQTPCLDALLRRAATFERMYVGSYPTLPNRLDLFLGKTTFPYYGWEPLPKDETTLAEVLTKHGYVTQIIYDTPHLTSAGRNFERGFVGWEWIRGQEGDTYRTDAMDYDWPAPKDKLRGRPGAEFGHTYAQYMRNTRDFCKETDYFAAKLFQTSMDWLDRNARHDKFFLWIDCFDPHEPFAPPEPYETMYDPDYKGDVMPHPHYGHVKQLYSPRELKNIHARYAGEVVFVDRWVGQFVQKVEALGLLENTVVILCCDHGFYFGEHGLIGKPYNRWQPDSGDLYEEILRQPFCVLHPKGYGSARRFKQLALPSDVRPTVLDFLGIEDPAPGDGMSLGPLLRGQTRKHRPYVVSGRPLQPRWGVNPNTITTDRWAMIHQPGEPKHDRLYDLEADPGQKCNVIRDNPKVAQRLARCFLEFLERGGYDMDRLAAFWEIPPA